MYPPKNFRLPYTTSFLRIGLSNDQSNSTFQVDLTAAPRKLQARWPQSPKLDTFRSCMILPP